MPMEPASLVVGAVAAASLAALTLLAETSVPEGAVIVSPEVIEILAHKTLRLYCLLGALGGGMVGVLIMGQAGAREMAGKWTVGVLSGIMFTPWLVKMTGAAPLPDTIVAASGVVSLLSWGCLHKLIPVLERLVVGRAKRILGDNEPTPKP